MSLLNDDQRQAIRDFEHEVEELLADMQDSPFDFESLQYCWNSVVEAWNHMEAQLKDDDDDSNPMKREGDRS